MIITEAQQMLTEAATIRRKQQTMSRLEPTIDGQMNKGEDIVEVSKSFSNGGAENDESPTPSNSNTLPFQTNGSLEVEKLQSDDNSSHKEKAETKTESFATTGQMQREASVEETETSAKVSSVRAKPPPVAAAATSPNQSLTKQKNPLSTDSAKRMHKSPLSSLPRKRSKPGGAVWSIESEVVRTARLVAIELEHGGWPEASPGARRQAAVALQEFCKTIFLPNLQQKYHAHVNTPTASTNERVFIATMLALREVLTQNAFQIFDLRDVPREGDELREQNDATQGHNNQSQRQQDDEEEERRYMAQLYATGVIFAAIKSTKTPEAESCLTHFTQVMDSYDYGSEFYKFMQPRSGKHVGVTPNGKVLGKEENVAWKVSFNRACEEHPVISRNTAQNNNESRHRIVQVPSANAVFVSMVEQTPHYDSSKHK